jgi:hypothetical protein
MGMQEEAAAMDLPTAEKELALARQILPQMGGDLYRAIYTDKVHILSARVNELKRQEMQKAKSPT